MMRWPRFQFTTRRMMLLVALTVPAFYSAQMLDRSAEYCKKAEAYGYQRSVWASRCEDKVFQSQWPLHEHARRCLAYYTAMEAKYRRAAWMPFMFVEPDPQAPR